MQTKLWSAVEVATGIIVGYIINVSVQILIFPLFGIDIPVRSNLWIGICFIPISFAKKYIIRRMFNRVTE